MKTNLNSNNNSNSNTNFSLQNIENYKKNIDVKLSEIMEKYSQIIIEYLKYIMKTIEFKKNKIIKFINLRGLNTVTHVFKYILYYTKDLNITFYQCEKAFYFYVEFVTQISDDDKAFLQLSSRDAINYVYKKTIFDINYEIKKNPMVETIETKTNFDFFDTYVNMYRKLIEKMIENDLFYNENYLVLIKSIENIINILNHANITNLKDVHLLESIIDHLSYKITDINLYCDIILHLIKKINKEPNLIEIIHNKLKTHILEFTEMELYEIIKNNKKFVEFTK
jgi:hypothetical protein